MINLADNWPEFVGGVLIVIGFLISFSLQSAVMSYITIIIAGLMFGRLWMKWNKSHPVPIMIIIFGFFVGFMVGDFYGNDLVVLILFLIGLIVGYMVHEKKVIR